MGKSKERVALYFPHEGRGVVEIDRSLGKCGVATLRFVVIDKDGQIRNGIDGWTNDLIARAQWNLDKVSEGVRTYGWELEYRAPFAVDLRRAEQMVKTLRRIAKADASLPIRATTFGQWVVLICRALGVKTLVVAKSDGGWSYSENQHHIGDITDAQSRIDNAIEPHVPKPQVTT
jgi:hypothetical protein